MATCSCGTKFRVKFANKSTAAPRQQKSPSSAAKPAPATQPMRTPQGPSASRPAAGLEPLGSHDGFWDEALAEPTPNAAPSAVPAASTPKLGKTRHRKTKVGERWFATPLVRIAKIIGGAALTVGSCWLIYTGLHEGKRMRGRVFVLPFVGLGLLASGLFGESE